MVDKPNSGDAPATPAATAPLSPARRPGHRATDMRDTVAELSERAQLISQEAGTKVAAAMKDVISAGAGIAGFAIESARDLVNFMVRRGQMTPEEADKLIREAEAAHETRSPAEKARPTATKIASERAAAAKAEAAARAAAAAAAPPMRTAVRPVVPPATAPAPKSKAEAAKPSVKTNGKPANAKSVAKTAVKSAVAKPASKAAAPKAPAKAAKVAKVAKPVAKATAKTAKKGKR